MTLEGEREVLGLWVQGSEGAKFWLSVLTELKNRGLRDIFYMCCDGLTGLPDAIEVAFPKTITQTCIVHMIRASMRYVTHTDRKDLCAALRPIYTAVSDTDALEALKAFEQTWGAKYPSIGKQWHARWNEVTPFLSLPAEVRRILYTTNAIESLNAQLRRVLRPKGAFSNDDSVIKVLFAALSRHTMKSKAPASWSAAMRHFVIAFADRITPP
jgi:putative transposase